MDKATETSRRDLFRVTAGALSAGATTRWFGCSQHKRAETERSATSRPFLSQRPRLGLDTYTLHRCLTASDPARRRDLWWLIDRLPELGLTGLQIDPSHFPGSDDATLDKLASAMQPSGWYVEFGMGGWDVNRLRERIRLTARFGGRAVRTFCGDENSTAEQIASYLRWAPPALREASAAADEYGVDIAVENHGDLTADQMKSLLDQVGHPRVGVCLDTGNSLFRREDPIRCAQLLAPYIRSMHLKDWTMSFEGDGKPKWREAVLGEGQVPVHDVLAIALEAQPELFIALETPVRRGGDEIETIEREWRNALANAAAARRLLARF